MKKKTGKFIRALKKNKERLGGRATRKPLTYQNTTDEEVWEMNSGNLHERNGFMLKKKRKSKVKVCVNHTLVNVVF